ncbi:unnamed protein product [Urochloa humidicola]
MTRKRRNSSCISDEVFLIVFSRLPAGNAVRCAALSKHYRRLVGSLNFWLLHGRHGPPMSHPHIAYMVSSMLPGHLFNEFHLAGNKGLRRALIDRETLYSSRQRYAGTCNGVVVLAAESFYFSTTVVLLNPAIAGSEDVVGINLQQPYHPFGCHRVSGFGYGPSTQRHKLLLTTLDDNQDQAQNNGVIMYNVTNLMVYTFGRLNPDQHQLRCRTVLSRPGTKIRGPSVHLDGKIYLLAERVLAFDVDSETFASIELPGEGAPEERRAKSELMEMSGRLCVATAGSGEGSIALWLLTADQQWEQRCLVSGRSGANKQLAGGWDCAGVLLLFFQGLDKEPDLILYDTRTKQASEPLHVPGVFKEPGQQGSTTTRVFCWGYQPTLVSPGSISGGATPRQRGGGGVVAALNPVLERDVKSGRERTLDTLCFMDMLLYIMRQLPDKANDVVREFSRGSLPFSLG